MTQPTLSHALPSDEPLPGVSDEAWYRRTIVGFDLETTGTDPTEARIVTAALVYHRGDGAIGPESRHWLVDPGIPIPAAATAVHGITTEHAREFGAPAEIAVSQIIDALDEVWLAGLPMVVFNAAYDLTVVAAGAARHGLAELPARPGWPAACIIDPLVIDREVDRYRRGKRTLQAAATHYRVPAEHAHSADGDAVSACLLARAIAADHPVIGNSHPVMLHAAQARWAGGWAARFEAYLRSRGEAGAVIDGRWPLRAP